jgi:hypothetical protein
VNRRTFLAASGVGLATPLVGCLGGARETPGTDPGTVEETETTTDAETTATAGPTELASSETVQYAATGTRPDWFEGSGDSVGRVVVIDSKARADAVLTRDLPTDRREPVADFLQNTDFSESVVLYVESVGPNACTDEIEVADLAAEDGVLTGTASVVDASEGGDASDGSDETDENGTASDGGGGMTACAEVLTYPSALVRATFSGEPATRVRLRLVDGWDNETEVAASADDPLAPDAADLDGYVKPEGDPATVPAALSCDDEGVQRVENWASADEIPWGETTGTLSENDGDASVFALRVAQREVALGETVELTMTNLTDERQYTGNRHKYSLELLTADGWQDVRVAPEDETVAYTDEAIGHDPGEGFQWTFELTETGILDGHVHEGVLEVCPDLQPGRYRFVSWEPVVAVAFDVTE